MLIAAATPVLSVGSRPWGPDSVALSGDAEGLRAHRAGTRRIAP